MFKKAPYPAGFSFLAVLWVLAMAHPGLAAGTSFTYQGKLDLNGAPVNGAVDVRLALFDDAAAGTQIGTTQTIHNVQVVEGLFTVVADFGDGAFQGSQRWLQIRVANPAGSAYVTLAPRQEVTAAPISTFSLKPWESAAGKTWYMGGDVGIGTSNPQTPLAIMGNGATKPVGITQNQVGGTSSMEFTTTDAADQQATRLMIRGNVDDTNIQFFRGARGSETETMRIDSVGNVGIGATNPLLSLGYPDTWKGLHIAKAENNNRAVAVLEGAWGARLHLRRDGVANPNFAMTYSYENPGVVFHWLNEDLSNAATCMRFHPNGNVGIGTGAIPTASLHIDNNNSITALRIESSLNGITATADGRAISAFTTNGTSIYGHAENGIAVKGTCTSPSGYAGYFQGRGFVSERLGIGRIPITYSLEVEGSASKSIPGLWLANSDARIKTDVRTISNALETLDAVRLVDYCYTDWYLSQHPKIKDHRYMSVIAQEFAEVFPDYVKPGGEELPGGDAILQVDTYPLTVYSAAAAQELHTRIIQLDAEHADLKRMTDSLEARITRLESGGR